MAAVSAGQTEPDPVLVFSSAEQRKATGESVHFRSDTETGGADSKLQVSWDLALLPRVGGPSYRGMLCLSLRGRTTGQGVLSPEKPVSSPDAHTWPLARRVLVAVLAT